MYAEILLNQNYSRVSDSFTYKVPNDLNLKVGDGAVVNFRNKKTAGLVLSLNKVKPEFETKEIIEKIEPSPLLENWQLELSDWLSEHYFCTKLDIFKSMLPKNIWRVPKRKLSKKEKKSEKEYKAKHHQLTEEQASIIKKIQSSKRKIHLLHGVTGSGKTEIYLRLIQNVLKENKQALLLVPEIALTPQLKHYLKAHIPELCVLHSRLSAGKRAENWKKIKSGEIKLILGSRSAIFSPFQNLGIIIMDEEHEWTYKQEQSPRYHAKKVGEKLSELLNAKLILGSATPSLESMHESKTGKIMLHSLPHRIDQKPMPSVEIVDMREELKGGNFSMFSYILEQKIKSKLEKKEQIILFLNRRGSASSTSCRDCGHVLECKDCEWPLTYHARKWKHQKLVCHHCGLIENMPSSCPNCKSPRLKHFGIGTEKVHSELQKLFPSARIQRADRDTMSGVESHTELFKALKNEEIDILIGTQMIAKGFDLPKVTLVGVLLADMGLHIPDFRASERSFQLLTQVAGRSGRGEKEGSVIIQSYSPEHIALVCSQKHDYLSFYEQEIKERKSLALPPFSKQIKLIIVSESKEKAHSTSEQIKAQLEENQTIKNEHKMNEI